MRHQRTSARFAPALCLTLLLLPALGAPVAHAQQTPSDTAVETLVAFVLSHQAEDGSFRAGVLDTGQFHTPGAIEALSAAGLDPREVRAAPGKPSAMDWLRDHRLWYDSLKPTEWQKQILGIAAGYADPSEFGGFDYVAALREHAKDGQMGSPTHLNDDMFGLLALRSAGVPPTDPLMQGMRDHLLRYQQESGAWDWARGTGQASIDMTGAAIAALAAGGVAPDHESIVRAISWLRTQVRDNGAFGDDNLQSTAWAVWGLRSVGENPEAWTTASGADPVAWLRARVHDGTVEAKETALWVARDVLVALSAPHYPVAGWLPLEPEVDTAAPIAGSPTQFRVAGATRAVWEFGDGARGEGTTTPHTYARQGTYLVNVTAWDDGYGKTLAQLRVEVDPAPPIAALQASRASAYRQEMLTFSAVESADPDGSIVAYAWDFGDGATSAWSTSPVADHGYSRMGNYTVRVHVRDADGLQASASTRVSVLNRPPVLEPFSDQVADRQAPLALIARASDLDGATQRLSYRWDMGDGTTLRGPSVQHQFALLGRFEVSVEATDEDGGSTLTRFFVTVLNLPPSIDGISVHAQDPQRNTSVRLHANATDADGTVASYRWEFGDGTTLETPWPEVAHDYAAAGSYEVRVRVRDNDGGVGVRALNLTVGRGGVSATDAGNASAAPRGEAASPANVSAPSAAALRFVASQESVHLGEEIHLEVQHAAEKALFRFDFGDGEVTPWLSTPSVRHAYVVPGDYEASVTIQPPDDVPFTARLRIQVHNALPEVRFLMPLQGEPVAPGTLEVRGVANDIDSGVAAVEVWTDAQTVRAQGTLAWSARIDVAPGSATEIVVHARAVDSLGAWGETVQLVLRVEPPEPSLTESRSGEESRLATRADAEADSAQLSGSSPEAPLESSSRPLDSAGAIPAGGAHLAVAAGAGFVSAVAAGALLLLGSRPRLRRNLAGLALSCFAVALVSGLFLLQEARLDQLPTNEEEVQVRAVFIGRDGTQFFNGTLRLANATALSALDEAARQGGFTYSTTYYDHFGPGGAGAFVDEVRGERAERGSADGWLYRIQRDGVWIRPDRSAAIYPLQDGDTVLWAWSSQWKDP